MKLKPWDSFVLDATKQYGRPEILPMEGKMNPAGGIMSREAADLLNVRSAARAGGILTEKQKRLISKYGMDYPNRWA